MKKKACVIHHNHAAEVAPVRQLGGAPAWLQVDSGQRCPVAGLQTAFGIRLPVGFAEGAEV